MSKFSNQSSQTSSPKPTYLVHISTNVVPIAALQIYAKSKSMYPTPKAWSTHCAFTCALNGFFTRVPDDGVLIVTTTWASYDPARVEGVFDPLLPHVLPGRLGLRQILYDHLYFFFLNDLRSVDAGAIFGRSFGFR